MSPPKSLPDSTRLLAAALDTLEAQVDYCKQGNSAHGPILVEGAVWCYKCGAIRMPGETNWTHPKGRR